MAEPDPEALSAAVNALYRIRAVEQPADADGLKEVWHQCAQGADLVSFVDRKGRVVRQELSLLEDYFRWTSAEGLSTGTSGRAQGSRARRAGEAVTLDRCTVPLRVLRAKAALASYQGTDRYLLNVQRVLALAADDLQLHDEPTVTQIEDDGPDAAVARPAKVGPRPGVLHWIVGALALAGLGLAGFLMTRP